MRKERRKVELRTAVSPRDVKHYTTERLREEFLIQNLFVPGEIKLVYSHIDRIITGAAVPVSPITLTAGDELRAEYFCQRRELGVINIGGAGMITVDGKVYKVGYKEAMYIGMGSKEIIFASEDEKQPAKFYLNSAPAHKTYPTVLIKPEGTPEEGVVIVKDENKVELGTLEDANHRVICKYILPGQVESCQLEMGMTKLEPGSVWNTMPCHTHDRRMEVYLYFDMPEDAFVMHYMGEPDETRHIVMRNEELVTGASYGIGFAIASAYAECGATICFNDIKQELVDKGIAAYAEKGIKAHGYVCDVTNEEAVNAMVAQIEKEVGTIDILVNNAGIIKRIPMTEMTADQFRQVIDVDLNAPFIVSKAVIPAMIKKGHGKIINICSMMSELGRETVSAYAAAKGGLKMLTKNICSEYGQYNIQCNGLGPGYIETPQTAPLREIQPDGSRHPFDQFICAKTPANRWLKPEELTGPAVFLASEASNAVNGHILYVDGGILAYIGKQPQ